MQEKRGLKTSSASVSTKEVKKNVLSRDEVSEIRAAFDLFDTNNTGRVSPSELKQAMQSLGFDIRNPIIYKLISDLDTNDAAKKGGVSFDTFLDAVIFKLADRDSREGVRRIFELLIDDPDTKTITVNALKKVSKELGESIPANELAEMIERASKNGSEITFDEFYDIMTQQ